MLLASVSSRCVAVAVRGEHGRTGGEAGACDGADEQGHAAPEADCWVAQHCRRPRTESPCGLPSSSSSSSLVQALSRLPLFPDVLRIARKISVAFNASKNRPLCQPAHRAIPGTAPRPAGSTFDEEIRRLAESPENTLFCVFWNRTSR